MQPESHYLRLADREIHYVAWGRHDAPPLVMWHGLARTGRDFDDIAAALASAWRVLCPDTIGRGLSAWSPEPDAEYCLVAYARLARGFADALGLARFAWVGTSMGGALGIAAAAGALRGRIRRMVLNDIGPTLPRAAFERIRAYVAQPPDFAAMTELAAYFRTISQPFGAHTHAQWRPMAETAMRRIPNGRVTTHSDPAIARQFESHPAAFRQSAA